MNPGTFIIAVGTVLSLGGCLVYATFKWRRAEKALMQFANQQQVIGDRLVRLSSLATVGMLASRVFHDLNSLLTGSMGYAQCIVDDASSDVQGDARKIIAVNQQAAKFTKQLLGLSRPSTPQHQYVSIPKVVSKVLVFAQREIDKAKIAVEENYDQAGNPLLDPQQMFQVILNLIFNAIQSMPEGGTLSIRTFSQDHKVVLEIRDTGKGIQKDHLDHIFDTFFTTRPKGTGLGLAICQNIVEQNGGTISVKSQWGKGSTFTVCLPTGRH